MPLPSPSPTRPLAVALAAAIALSLLAPAAQAATGGTPAAEDRGPAGTLDFWARLDQLIARNAFPAAEAELRGALRDRELSAGMADRLTYQLGYVQRRANRPAEALASLGRVPRDSRWFLPALAERAAIQRAQADDTAAIALYEQLLSLSDEDRKDAARAPLADLYFTSGQYPKALEHYRALANAFGPYQERGLFAWGWSLLRLKQEEAATNVWKQALERYPTSRYSQAVRLALGNVMLARGEHLAASTYYNEAARHGRDEALMARAELLAGEAYADAKDYALAISHYRAVPADSPLREPAAYGEAWATWQQGKFTEAKKLFEGWLTKWPQSTYRGAAFYALGILERQLGRPDAALDTLAKVAAVAPRSGWAEDATYQLARAAFDANDHQEAIALGRKIEGQWPRSRWLGPVLWMRGESYLALGLFQDAVRAYSQLAVLGNLGFLAGQGEEVDYKIGMAHFYAGNYQESARVLEAVDRGPLEDDATFWQAEARYRLGQYDSARALYGRLIARHQAFPRLPEAYYGLGWAAFRLNDLTGARNAFAEAIRKLQEGRTRQDATYRLGLVLIDLRDWDNARQTFEALLKGPVDAAQAADARFQIAWSLYRQGRLDEAATSFGAFAQAHGQNRLAPQALVWQGRSLFRLKRYPDAITALLAATAHPQATAGQQYEAREQLAAAYYNNGQFEESRRAYETLMSMGDVPPLMAVGEHRRQPGGQRRNHRDVRDALLVGAQVQRLADDLVEIHQRPRALTLACEREQVADDAGGALRLAQDDVESAPHRVVGIGVLRQPLGPRQNRRQRIVQLVGHARDRLPQRRHFFGLQELVVEIARLHLELLPLAHVAHQRLDAHGAGMVGRFGSGRHLDPHLGAVGLLQPQQVVADRAGVRQPLEERLPRLRIDEPGAVERPHVAVIGLRRVAEQQLEVRIRRQRRRRSAVHEADVHALVHRLEEARERRCAIVHHGAGRHFFFAGGGGVGVLLGYCGVHLRSIDARMLCTSAPEL